MTTDKTSDEPGQSDSSKSRTPEASQTGPAATDAATRAGQAASLANAAGNGAGGVAGKTVKGDGSSTTRRYAGKAVAGAVDGGLRGGVHGAAAGAAKEVGVEAAKDVAKGVSKVTGGSPDAEPADKRLGAGGTSYVRTAAKHDEGLSSKAAKGVAVGGAAAAAPAAMALVMLMALLNWLKSTFFAFVAMAANLASLLWSLFLSVLKSAGSAIAAPFLAIGGFVAHTAAAVFGVAAATVAPVAAALSGVVATVTAAALLGTLFTGVIDNTAQTEGQIDSTTCRPPADGGDVQIPTGDIPADTMEAARRVHQVLSGWGMPDENIAGILGNWDAESGIDPTGVEDIFNEPFRLGPRKKAKLAAPGSNYGIGLGQWTADRHRNLLAFAQKSRAEWFDIEQQLKFMVSVEEGSDAGIVKRMISTSLGSPGTAAQHFHLDWERSASRDSTDRMARANRWMGLIAGMPQGDHSSSAIPVDDSDDTDASGEQSRDDSLITSQPARWNRQPIRVPKALVKGGTYHVKGNNYALENSIQGLDTAARLGYAGIDIDSWVTRDGVPVAIHWVKPAQNGFKGKTAKIRVPDQTYAQLQRLRHPKGYKIERMETMFREAAKRNLRIEFEIKYPKAYTKTATFIPLRKVATEVGLNVQVKTQGGSTAAQQIGRLKAAHEAGFPTILMTQKRSRIPRSWWPWVDYYRPGGGQPKWYGPLSGHRGRTAPEPGSDVFSQISSVSGACDAGVGHSAPPSTGEGSVSLTDGGLNMEQAEKLIALYRQEGDAFLDQRYGQTGGPGTCGSDHSDNCVSFSTYFVNKYTSFQKYAPGDGRSTASSMASMMGKKVTRTPTAYSVGSGPSSSGSAYGHTFVVLGIKGDAVIIGEAGYCTNGAMTRVRVIPVADLSAWVFVDVSDLLLSESNLT